MNQINDELLASVQASMRGSRTAVVVHGPTHYPLDTCVTCCG